MMLSMKDQKKVKITTDHSPKPSPKIQLSNHSKATVAQHDSPVKPWISSC